MSFASTELRRRHLFVDHRQLHLQALARRHQALRQDRLLLVARAHALLRHLETRAQRRRAAALALGHRRLVAQVGEHELPLRLRGGELLVRKLQSRVQQPEPLVAQPNLVALRPALLARSASRASRVSPRLGGAHLLHRRRHHLLALGEPRLVQVVALTLARKLGG